MGFIFWVLLGDDGCRAAPERRDAAVGAVGIMGDVVCHACQRAVRKSQ